MEAQVHSGLLLHVGSRELAWLAQTGRSGARAWGTTIASALWMGRQSSFFVVAAREDSETCTVMLRLLASMARTVRHEHTHGLRSTIGSTARYQM